MYEETYKLAIQGDADSQYKLGTMFAFGKGISEDYTEAVKWYRKAVEQDHPEAMHSLAWMYKNGNGVPQDYAEAAKLYWRIINLYKNTDCDINSPLYEETKEAYGDLGVLYKKGLGVPKDLKRAKKFARKSQKMFDVLSVYYSLDDAIRNKNVPLDWVIKALTRF